MLAAALADLEFGNSFRAYAISNHALFSTELLARGPTPLLSPQDSSLTGEMTPLAGCSPDQRRLTDHCRDMLDDSNQLATG